MYIKKLTNNYSGENKPRSLDFLHKPQRVTQLKTLYAEDSLQRNTNLNRGPPPDYENVAPTDSREYYGDGTLHRGSIGSLNSYFPDVDEYYPPKPIRKKSGELVKSSLKQHHRSKSLPATPTGREPRTEIIIMEPPKRSKSVHFDQRDVVSVKYFQKDERPVEVAQREVEEDQLSFTPKQLSFMNSWLSNSTAEETKRPLRRSKKHMMMMSGSGSGPSPATTASGSSMPPVPGLYNKNFPILSNKNPTSLKLNIFLNIAHGKQVFLQDLSLLGDGNYVVGKVLVKNICYDKQVIVRYTWDQWNTTHDVQCVWFSSGDIVLPGMNMDMFKFVVDVPIDSAEATLATTDPDKEGGREVQFCIRYTTRDGNYREEHWDNNNGKNYIVAVVIGDDARPVNFHDPFS